MLENGDFSINGIEYYTILGNNLMVLHCNLTIFLTKPAITTGIIDFIISSGFMTAMAAIPVPDLAVP